MSTITDTTFKITNTKLYVPIVTLSAEDNVRLMKDLKDLFFEMSIKQKQNQKILTTTILQDFLLILLFKELEDCLLLLLTIIIMVIKTLKETVTQNIFF